MRIVCWQTILMKYHTFFFQKLRKMSQNLSSAAVVIGALRVNLFGSQNDKHSILVNPQYMTPDFFSCYQ